MTDIDIDFIDPSTALNGLSGYCLAAQFQPNGLRENHTSGVYFQDIPRDPLDGLAAWDYQTAATHGYFKVDFLTNSIYCGVRDETHLLTLLATEPPWDRLTDITLVGKLKQQLGEHFNIVQMIEPQCIEDLAVCLALIRPGKRHLINRPRFEIMRDIWMTPTDDNKYQFKRAHALAFAASIVVQLNLLVEQGI